MRARLLSMYQENCGYQITERDAVIYVYVRPLGFNRITGMYKLV